MATVLEHITGALRLIGVAGEGMPVSSEIAVDGMTALNQLLDSWSTLGLMVHSNQLQEMPWNASVASKTVGPTGDFVGARPVSVRNSSYIVISGVYYPLTMLNEAEFREECNDNLGGTPDRIWVDMTVPDCTVYLYPIPSVALTLNLSSAKELTQAAELDDELVLPPGYLRAFRYNLAVELAPEFGVEASATVKTIATASLADVKRTNLVNNKTNKLSLPPGLVKCKSNIYKG